MVVVRSCCCGFSLAHGTIGAGIVSVVESLLLFGYGGFILSDDSNARGNESISNVIGYSALAQGALTLVATIVLFFAVKLQRRSLLLPWIVLRGILLGFAILGCIVFLASGRIVLACLAIMWNSLLIYLFIVVLSYYQTDMERISSSGTVLAPGPVFATVPQQPGQQYVIHIPSTNVGSSYPFSNPIMGGPKPLTTQGYVLTPSPQGPLYQSPGSYAQPPPYPTNVYSDQLYK